MTKSEVFSDGAAGLGFVTIVDGIRKLDVEIVRGLLEPTADVGRGMEQPVVDVASETVDDLAAILESVARQALALHRAVLAIRGRHGREPLQLNLKRMQSAAAAELATGVHSPDRAVLLASYLPFSVGSPALAAALRTTECAYEWEGLTLGEVLAAFRDSDHHRAAVVLGAAALHPATQWIECDRQQLRALAVALERQAEG
ncbi:hypothetical protein VSS74_03900 [Conexibacter stalactiti]|uniref:DUF222 domain-containing protein n=1 Tax=Conexibacter stalactiti TaxID=1940611 RepID=A0ABU4HJH8_9ACTN|nr:hypothetical protein [Conexibacter stalactiti]MDW5593466.1 hypothetical protein [Conexibacter stalactiti]MEC5034107.1 hypothetical protein [Conexibacter stalactiti]